MTVVTTVSARGFVTADYDTAHFALTFSELADKAKAAKLALKRGVEQITATLDMLKAKGLTMGASTYRTGVTVQPNYVYSERSRSNELRGQKATYTVSFQTTNLELVNEVYDVLSELDLNEFTLQSPTYSVKAEAELKQQALEDAWKVAQGLFANQCSVLGLDVNNFSVNNWQVDYSGRQYGKARNFTNSVASSSLGGDDDDAIELNAGRARVEVTLSVSYVRRSL